MRISGRQVEKALKAKFLFKPLAEAGISAEQFEKIVHEKKWGDATFKEWVERVNNMINRRRIIKIFTVTEPHCLQYRTRGRNRASWLADLPVLKEMINDGQVEIVHKDSKSITYHLKQIPS